MKAALALVIFINGVLGEYCPAYNDSYGRYKKGFYCPKILHLWRLNSNYCCGNDTYHVCCNDISTSIFNHTDTAMDAYWQEYWPYFAFIGMAVIVLLFSPFLAPHHRSGVAK